MLVINPDECIDCGVCEPECPAEAIEPENDENTKWLEINRKYSEEWPNITMNKGAMDGAEEMDGKEGKEELLSPNPGEG